jgi:hypothetical protein
MKVVLLTISLCIGFTAGLAAQESSYPSLGADCTSFSSEEQQFASLFCERFNQDQRDMAMQMAGQLDEYGNILTEDQAVNKVARDNQMPAPMAQPRNNPSRGCPVK